MADEPLEGEQVPIGPDEPQQQRSGSSAWNVVGVVALVVIIILILLLLRDCGGPNAVGGGSGGDKTIVTAPRYEPLPGVVSVWVSGDTTIDAVLGAMSIRSEDVVSLGGGRYIIAVPEGQEDRAVETLKTKGGVFDAGLVYDEDTPRE